MMTVHEEYNEKTRNRSSDFQKNAWQNLMHIFVEFGEMKAKEPEHAEVQAQVKKMKRPCKKLAWPLFILLSIFYINERC